MSKRSHFLEGLIVGAALGAVLGLLFAPKSGKELRGQIKRLKDDREDLLQETKEKTEAMIANTMDSIKKGFEKVGRMVENRKNERQRREADDGNA